MSKVKLPIKFIVRFMPPLTNRLVATLDATEDPYQQALTETFFRVDRTSEAIY